MTILVTGGAGSMGRLVVERLRETGRRVRVLDIPSASYSGLEGEPGIEVVRGDITDRAQALDAAMEVDAVIHLAAVLPPVADEDPQLAQRVNVEGTRVLLEAASQAGPQVRFVFSSSVSVYGNTADRLDAGAAIPVDHPLAPDDIYARTKAESEALVRESALSWVALRISGVAVPVFQAPPAIWPFTAEQRIEFVHRDDAVSALVAAATSAGVEKSIFNISGGQTWQMTGGRYVTDYFELVGVDPDEAVYQAAPGHFDWYDSRLAQEALGFQNTAYAQYLAQIQGEIERLLEA